MAFKQLFKIYFLLILPLLIYCIIDETSENKLDSGSQLIYPVRISPNGEKVQNHFISKRSTENVEKFEKNVRYIFPAFGRQFLLDLTYTKDFISPSFVVQYHSGNYTWLDEGRKRKDVSRCYYTGRVNNADTSQAVLSLCDGMMGVLYYMGEKYLVEPVNGETTETMYTYGDAKPHFIHKHSSLLKNKPKESHCAVQENYKHTRRKEEEGLRTFSSVVNDDFNTSSNALNHFAHSHKENVYNVDIYVNNVHGGANSSQTVNSSQNVNIDSQNVHSSQSVSNSQSDSSSHHSQSGSSNSRNSHHVHKRSTSYKRNVEVMVAADNKMLRYHGDDLEKYILTLMSVVASIYRDPSIGNFINIVVVKIDVFRSEQDGPRITNNAAASLSDFCRWQHLNNIADDNDPMHYDTAILITRQNICRAPQKCDTLGLAELGTMCDSLRSCSIIEDNGISAAYTIAHELGHIFNLPHDDHKRCVDYLEGKATDHVMSPTLDHNTSPWTWSKCSAALITKFIEFSGMPFGSSYEQEIPSEIISHR